MEEIDSDNDDQDNDDNGGQNSQEPDLSHLESDIVPASQPEVDFSQPDPVQDVVDIEDSPAKNPQDKTIQNDAELGKLLGMASTRAEIEDKISELSAQLLAAKKQQVAQKLGPSKNSRL